MRHRANMDRAQNFINGEWVKSVTGRAFSSVDPSTELPIAEVAQSNAADIDRAVIAADHAFPAWRGTAPARRGQLLLALADCIADHKEELARLETIDVGKPLKESRGDVDGVLATLAYNAGAADKIEGATIPLSENFV